RRGAGHVDDHDRAAGQRRLERRRSSGGRDRGGGHRRLGAAGAQPGGPHLAGRTVRPCGHQETAGRAVARRGGRAARPGDRLRLHLRRREPRARHRGRHPRGGGDRDTGRVARRGQGARIRAHSPRAQRARRSRPAGHIVPGRRHRAGRRRGARPGRLDPGPGAVPVMVPPAGFRDSWRTVRGLRLHALESVSSPSPPSASASPSPAVALLPGLVTASRSMVPLARALTAKGIQVRILDPPGFGYSDKPRRSLSVGEQAALVAEWLAASYGAPVQLLGNSFGTQVVAAVAAGHPHAVARLILLSPTMSPYARRRLRWLATLPAPETPFSPRRESRWRVRLLG